MAHQALERCECRRGRGGISGLAVDPRADPADRGASGRTESGERDRTPPGRVKLRRRARRVLLPARIVKASLCVEARASLRSMRAGAASRRAVAEGDRRHGRHRSSRAWLKLEEGHRKRRDGPRARTPRTSGSSSRMRAASPALHSPDTGMVDFPAVARAYAEEHRRGSGARGHGCEGNGAWLRRRGAAADPLAREHEAGMPVLRRAPGRIASRQGRRPTRTHGSCPSGAHNGVCDRGRHLVRSLSTGADHPSPSECTHRAIGGEVLIDQPR